VTPGENGRIAYIRCAQGTTDGDADHTDIDNCFHDGDNDNGFSYKLEAHGDLLANERMSRMSRMSRFDQRGRSMRRVNRRSTPKPRPLLINTNVRSGLHILQRYLDA
jgi:hypothetical protein